MNIVIVGLGYIGFFLALQFVRRGVVVLELDTDPAKVEPINRDETYIKHMSAADIWAQKREEGMLPYRLGIVAAAKLRSLYAPFLGGGLNGRRFFRVFAFETFLRRFEYNLQLCPAFRFS